MLHFIFGRAGFGKTHWVQQQLLKNATQQNAILLVPEQASFETERAMVGLNLSHSVEVLSFSRLCDRVFKLYGGIAGKRLGDQEKLLLMHRAVLQVGDRLQLYRRGHKSIRFATHVLSIATECGHKGITPEQLMTASITLPQGGLKQKLQELALMLSAYQSLVRESYIDPTEELSRLHDLLQQVPFWQDKTVYIDGFKDFTAPQKKLVSQMIVLAKEVYVTLCTDGKKTEHPLALFANVSDLAEQMECVANDAGIAVCEPICLTENHRAKTPGLQAVEQVFVPKEVPCCQGDSSVMICGCDDIYDEVDYVAASICRLVQEEGLRFREITVISRDLNRYSDLLTSAFERFGIPCFSDDRRSVTHLPLFALLRKTTELAEKGLDTANLLSLMKTELWDLTLQEIAMLENYAFVWSVEGNDWLHDFNNHPDGIGDKQPTPEAVIRINQLRKKAVLPIVQLRKEWQKCRTVTDFCTVLYGFLEQNHIYTRLQALSKKVSKQDDPFEAEDLLRCFELCNQLLDKMVFAMGDTQVSGQEFAQTLTLIIGSSDLGKIPQGIDQVVLGSADRTRPAAPKAVFVIGANQGMFPAVPASGGLLSDYERKILKEQQQLAFSDRCEFETVEEDFLFYQAVSSASHFLCMTYIRSGGESNEPCRWVTYIKERLPNVTETTSDDGRQADVLAFARAPLPTFDLLAQRYTEADEITDSLYQYIGETNPAQTELLRRLTNPQDCSLSAEGARSLFREKMRVSPTAIEAYHKCRFNYFCKYGMGVRPLRPVGLDVLAKGTLVHYVLEKIINRYGSNGLHTLTTQECEEQVHALIWEFVQTEMGGFDQKSSVFWFQLRRIEILAISLVEHLAAEMKDSKFETVACELKVGPGEAVESLRIPLTNGGEVTVIGVLDRLDVYQKDGQTYFRVVDYKTGSKEFHLEDIYYGIGLQMFMYLYSVEQNGHQFGENRYPAGVLYMPAKRSTVLSTDPKEVEKQLADRLRMKGVVLDDMDVVRAMEPDVSGTYIPVTVKLSGDPTERSALASLEFFGKTRRHIETLLREMGDALLNGEITCDPLDPKGTKGGACTYCDYKAACPLLDDALHRQVASLSTAEKKELMKGGDWNGD
ncbi:MAG: exodeoxyribonuclease V subunit gamma [Clostridia bacterium]|nr:exodeoxyribonuclease V subunit gamma [Clostridia bacterium]